MQRTVTYGRQLAGEHSPVVSRTGSATLDRGATGGGAASARVDRPRSPVGGSRGRCGLALLTPRRVGAAVGRRPGGACSAT